MSNPSNEQMNVVIARFDERKFYGKFTIDDYGPNTCNAYPVMKYHESWDWLMPVVEKIETLRDDKIEKVWIAINGKTCSMWTYWQISDVLRGREPFDTYRVKVTRETKVAAVHEAVYQFIQWYAKQKEVNNER